MYICQFPLLSDCEAALDISTQIFKDNLKKYSGGIITLAKTKTDVPNKSKQARESYKIEVQGLIKLLSRNTVIHKGSNHETNVALLTLPYVFERSTKIFAKNNLPAWNPSFDEISKSFIYQIDVILNLRLLNYKNMIVMVLLLLLIFIYLFRKQMMWSSHWKTFELHY